MTNEKDLLALLSEHMEAGSWEEQITEFAHSHLDAFKANLDEMLESRPAGEHHHGLYEVYRDFVALTDHLLEEFLEEHGLKQQDFIEICHRAREAEDGNCSLIDGLLSATDYKQFVSFMLDFQNEADGNEEESLTFEPPPR
eukprot:TRINITY_DN18167_c0_g1_i1.p1 TRINITY_DN18167_c0_g1~~TRINITY_DN18167_c0_g1_i1.p1  ORF type:complete len:141 (+),score=35.10 TRINITY_DN18167_c0_g1_i1:30-452(+)